VLLTRRADNGQWCLTGGRCNRGESVTQTCEREVTEEAGPRVRIERLVGVYTDPYYSVEGEVDLRDETTDARFFFVSDAVKMALFLGHVEQIQDSLEGRVSAFIR
jgi:ADP-ribose pyrophosphatase YjhB (NUDIX family)